MKGPNKKDKPVEEQSWMICIIRCQLHKAIIITPQQKGIPVFQNVHSTTIHKAPNWKPPKYPSIAKQIHRLWCGHREEQSTPGVDVLAAGLQHPHPAQETGHLHAGMPPRTRGLGKPPALQRLACGGLAGLVTANLIPLYPLANYLLSTLC